MSFFRSSPESAPHPSRHPKLDSGSSRAKEDPGSKPGMTTSVLGESTFHEAILASSSSVRDSLPKEHRAHFETLRQEIIDFAKAHEIPRDTLAKPDALREAASKLSIPDLQQLANLLERFEYLLVHHEPKKEDYTEALEHAEEFYHLKKQYDSQVALLEQVGILKEGAITCIDGYEYPIPTLEQIASRLFERRKELSTKHDQGFTKLLLVPFGMSLDALRKIFKQFLLTYKKDHSVFDLNTNEPIFESRTTYKGADIGGSPQLVYYPMSFDKKNFPGKTKFQILMKQRKHKQKDHAFVGWTVHLLQPSDPTDPHSPGFASIPRKGEGGTPQGDLTPRPPLEADQSPNEYLSLLQSSKDDPNSPYFQESGMTPEDWIVAFMMHLFETGKPLDDWHRENGTSSHLIGTLFRYSIHVPRVYWSRNNKQVILGLRDSRDSDRDVGVRTSVIV